MNKLLRSITAMALLASVACSESTPTSTDASSAASAPEASAPAAKPTEPAAAPVESLAKNMATDPVSSQIGQKVDGRLTSNGKAGFLLFGPYVAFAPGSYTATIVGEVGELRPGTKVRLDVVSAKGKTVHGQVEVAQAGDLPAFDFTVPEVASDLEVRVLVPGGGEVTLESYSLDKKL